MSIVYTAAELRFLEWSNAFMKRVHAGEPLPVVAEPAMQAPQSPSGNVLRFEKPQPSVRSRPAARPVQKYAFYPPASSMLH